MGTMIEGLMFACLVSLIFTGNVFGDWPDDDEDETDIAYSDSWTLGTPDNIPKTEVIILKKECECSR